MRNAKVSSVAESLSPESDGSLDLRHRPPQSRDQAALLGESRKPDVR